MTTDTTLSPVVLDAAAFLDHWQGHRRLTRRVIEAFPERDLFHFTIGGMRPFAAMAFELVEIAAGGVRGIATGNWTGGFRHHVEGALPPTREALLREWDETTAVIDEIWPTIAPGRFQETDRAFGEYDGRVYEFLNYFVDNEVHHRGQGYVYLRALGIEPPGFYERQ
jgi:uncharacterized damage-inducible protein DinB